MAFEFDRSTGFLITKALKKLMPDTTAKVDASQKDSNNTTTIINNLGDWEICLVVLHTKQCKK